MKSILYLMILLTLSQAAPAQTDTAWLKARIRVSADSLAKGFVQKDWELFTRYSNPALVGSLGGKESFIHSVRSRLEDIPDTAWKRYEPGDVLQVVRTDSDQQAVVELHTVLEWMGLRITTTHYLIAESWNGGQDWTFFDSQSDRDLALLIKPNLSPQLHLPSSLQKTEALDK